MSATTRVSLLFSGCLCLFGCTPAEASSASSGSQMRDNTEAARVNADKENAQARLANQEYAYAQRAEYVNGLELELRVIQEEFDTVVGKVEASSDARKLELKESIAKMRLQLDAAKVNLNAARNATEANWVAVKTDIRSSWNSLHDSLDQSREWLSEKIRP